MLKFFGLLTLTLTNVLGVGESQVITITEAVKRPNCSLQSTWLSAVSQPSRSSQAFSTVIVIATETVYPSPSPSTPPNTLNDTAVAAGTPFSLEIDVSTPGKARRQTDQRTWLMANGNTTTDTSQSATFQIVSQHLYIDAILMSTNAGVVSQPFAPIVPVGAIQTEFGSSNAVLSWINPFFENGETRFFKAPAGQLDNAMIVALFSGPPDPGMEAIGMAVRPGEAEFTGA